MWDAGGGTELGLFPLSGGDERLQSMPVLGHWKSRDPSLTSIGLIPAAQLTLAAPSIPPDFVAESLTIAGAPPTPLNVDLMGRKLGELVLIKALQYIGSVDARAAETFAAQHAYDGGPAEAYMQSVVDDLVRFHPRFTPYVQNIATRGRAVLLDALAADPSTLPLQAT